MPNQPQNQKNIPKKALTTAKILKVRVSSTNQGEVLAFVRSSLKLGRKFFITTPNPEIIVQAQSNPKLMKALNKADIALPDGFGLIIASKLLETPRLTRLQGREIMLDLFRLANDQNLKIFLLGATPEVNQKAVQKAKAEFLNLKIKGDSGPILHSAAEIDSLRNTTSHKDTLDKINKYGPDLLFVAFGAPKQELWLTKHWSKLKIGGAMVVGGALDFYVGAQKLPPKFIADLGLEWLWRLIHNPRRLPRILNATVVFPYLVLKEFLKD